MCSSGSKTGHSSHIYCFSFTRLAHIVNRISQSVLLGSATTDPNNWQDSIYIFYWSGTRDPRLSLLFVNHEMYAISSIRLICIPVFLYPYHGTKLIVPPALAPCAQEDKTSPWLVPRDSPSLSSRGRAEQRPVCPLIDDFFSAPGHVNGTSQISLTERQSSWPMVSHNKSTSIVLLYFEKGHYKSRQPTLHERCGESRSHL